MFQFYPIGVQVVAKRTFYMLMQATLL